MCGIVGAIAQRNVVPVLLEGLRKLEYRGYDSAGIAVVNDGLHRLRSVGRVGSGLGAAVRADLLVRLRARVRDAPLVPCVQPEAQWVEPELFCAVSYAEQTESGELRHPVLEGLVGSEGRG